MNQFNGGSNYQESGKHNTHTTNEEYGEYLSVAEGEESDLTNLLYNNSVEFIA